MLFDEAISNEIELLSEECLHQLIEVHASKKPDSIAVVCQDSKITYKELSDRSNQLANYLISLSGIRVEVPVGICMDRSINMMIAILGVLKAGCCYVPLDPLQPAARLKFMLSDAELPYVITQEKHLKALQHETSQLISMDGISAELEVQSRSYPSSCVLAENLAYIIYTSGSTGKPKGVMIEHRSVVNLLMSMVHLLGCSSHDVFLALSTLSFDLSISEIFAPLIIGAKLCLASDEIRTDGDKLSEYISSQKDISIIHATPATWQMLFDSNWEIRDGIKMLSGGEALNSVLAKRMLSMSDEVWNLYGPTEATVWASAYCFKKIHDLCICKTVPIGFPLNNTKLYILDKQMNPVSSGEIGELYIAGKCLARGYLNRPELTKEKFIFSSIGSGCPKRLYKTGDLACYLPDGNIEYIGRSDSQVKIRGFRIELGEVEAALLTHPSIKNAVVLVRNDQGQMNYLIGYYVADNPGVTGDALRKFLKDKVPEYMIPSFFILLEKFPLNSNGKIDRKSLPQLLKKEKGNYAAPKTDLEKALVDIWQEVFKTEVIGVTDSFYNLGGHSLLAMKIVSRIRSNIKLDVTIRDIFDKPVIQDLARHLEYSDNTKNTFLLQSESSENDPSFPLSPTQQGMWLVQQVAQNSSAYNVPMTLHFEGELNFNILEKSINLIIERHGVLRTTYHAHQGNPRQLIRQKMEISIPFIDLRGISGNEKGKKISQLSEEINYHRFDMSQGPLVCAKLLQLSQNEYVLLMCFHHIVCDEISLKLFIKELVSAYKSYQSNTEMSLPQLSLQYCDYAKWYAELLTSNKFKIQLEYWKRHLNGKLPLLKFYTDFPFPKALTTFGDYIQLTLSEELTHKIKKICSSENVTPYMLLLTAYYILLHKYTGQSDIIVGIPVSNRNQNELENLIGCFINSLPLRIIFRDESTIKTLLNDIKLKSLDGFKNKDIPFESIVKHINPNRVSNRTAIFQVMFSYNNSYEDSYRCCDLDIKVESPVPIEAKYEVTMHVYEKKSSLDLTLNYRKDLFSKDTVTRFIGHFVKIIESTLDNINQNISELCVLTDLERTRQLIEWNETENDYPKDRCVHELFEKQVELTPDAIALVCENQCLTYRELNENANQLANYLTTIGVGPDKLVGISIDRSLDTLVGILGILKAGGAYMPIDPKYPQDRINLLIKDSEISVIVTQEKYQGKFSLSGSVFKIDTDWGVVSKFSKDNPKSGVLSSNLVYMIYTSGSTGTPKGVMIEHQQLVNYVFGIVTQYKINNPYRYATVSTINADLGNTMIYSSLLTGGELHLLPKSHAFSPQKFRDYMQNNEIDLLKITPSHLHSLLPDCPESDYLPRKLLFLGGEPLPWKLVKCINEASPELKVVNHYGPTETTVGVTTKYLSPSQYNKLSLTKYAPIGKPISNIKIYILDKHLCPVPIGVAGQVCVSGDGLARGYKGNISLNSTKFVQNPFMKIKYTRLYKTGDIGRFLPDGTVELLGRIDRQVKISGNRIELEEIESILRNHNSISDCFVAKRDESLIVYYVSNQAISSLGLRRLLREKLPDYMIPSHFIFCDKLPLTSNGKIDQTALSKFGPYQVKAEQQDLAPVTPTEAGISKIWSELIPESSISQTTNFFDIGGYSLLAIKAIGMIYETIGVELTFRDLINNTLGQIAKICDDHNKIKN